MKNRILEVNNLEVQFKVDKSKLTAVKDVSFFIEEDEILGLVGESGSGKSVTSLSILRLLPENGEIANGTINYNGRDLAKISISEIRKIRGSDISMIFQDPMSSLNPVMRIGDQLIEATKLHRGFNNQQAKEHAIEMIKKVGIPVPEDIIKRFPHQLSGGMSQRVMIAMAISCNSKILIADEPTTALDVTIQAQVMELIEQLKEEEKMGVLLITHDLGVVAEMCDRVMVMYCGRIVEVASVNDLFDEPKHPYTKGLIQSVPKLGTNQNTLSFIKGRVPDLSNLPIGCKFAPRCDKAIDICFKSEPELISINNNRQVRCHLIKGAYNE